MISREEAIRLLDPATTLEELTKIDYYAGFYGNEAMKKALNEAFTLAIEALSHERPKGRWIGWHTDKFVGYDEYGIAIYRHCHYYSCRKCGRRTAVKTNYCPDCGAEMVRGEEE